MIAVHPLTHDAPLTERELSILALIVDGLMNKEMAHALGLSRYYVGWVVQNLFAKTGTHTRHELVAYAFRSGIVKVEGRS